MEHIARHKNELRALKNQNSKLKQVCVTASGSGSFLKAVSKMGDSENADNDKGQRKSENEKVVHSGLYHASDDQSNDEDTLNPIATSQDQARLLNSL